MNHVRTLSAALAASSIAHAAPTKQEAPQASTPESIREWQESLIGGRDALRVMGDDLATHAEGMALTEAQLARAILADPSLMLTPNGDLVAFCPAAPEPSANAERVPAPEQFALADAFNLNSRPGSKKTIYLDFDGHLSTGNNWGHTINFPSYNTSGSSNNFSNGELSDIIAQWVQVAEDFSSFDINVTTQDPGLDALVRDDTNDDVFGVRVVMTQITDGFFAGSGGVALLSSFRAFNDTPCFGFNKGVLNGAMTASHEAGHTLGLIHDGLFGSTYHPGSNQSGQIGWGPIMGAPFGRNLTQWSNGDYQGATAQQDDLTAITSPEPFNGINFIEDDHAITNGGTRLDHEQTVDGLIESSADNDSFVFNAPCGDVTISLETIDNGPNVDLKLDLYNNNTGTYLGEFDTTSDTALFLELDLEPGEYFFTVSATFTPLTNGPASAYGSMGQYAVTVNDAGECCPGDIDGNGSLTPADFTAWLNCFNNPSQSGCESADIDNNGTISPADFTAWLAEFNQGC